MKKIFMLLLLLLLAACGSSETAVNEETAVDTPTTAPVAVEPTDSPAVVEEEPTAVVEEAAEVVEEMAEETAVSEEVVPVAAKPKLVEFYADW